MQEIIMQSYEFEARVAEVKRRAHGRWGEILRALGVDEKILNRRNQPCPLCGGTDRFQYTDKFGEGNYHCRSCGAGGGLKLAQAVLGTKFGELLDKLAILQIKSERMTDADKLANVRKELSALEQTWMAHPAAGKDIVELRAQLKAVNERLWDIEDDIRRKEQAQAFDAEFIRLARAVYFENDDRARIKREINLALGSSYVEEKSYQDYRTGAAP